MKKCSNCQEIKPNSEFHKGTGKSGLDSRCKTCKKKKANQKYRDDWFNMYTIVKKAECKKKDLPFDLSGDFLEKIWTEKCPVFKKKFVRHDKKDPFCPALDRLDPLLGYVKGNVVWISSRANRIKYDATLEELKKVVCWFEGATTIPKGSTLK